MRRFSGLMADSMIVFGRQTHPAPQPIRLARRLRTCEGYRRRSRTRSTRRKSRGLRAKRSRLDLAGTTRRSRLVDRPRLRARLGKPHRPAPSQQQWCPGKASAVVTGWKASGVDRVNAATGARRLSRPDVFRGHERGDGPKRRIAGTSQRTRRRSARSEAAKELRWVRRDVRRRRACAVGAHVSTLSGKV